MSASLVGSEMCIRDRHPAASSSIQQHPTASSCIQQRPAASNSVQQHPAVSYTHLTLPTICSV
eukprot:359261-Alexandrium_andersonii.AAC.1